MGVWKLLRLSDGAIELRYSDCQQRETSCGLCSPATPVALVLEWIVENGGDLDLVVDERGVEFVKLPKVAASQ